MIAEDDRQVIHLAIGRLLLQNLSEAEQAEHAFDLAEQFNKGRSLIEEKEESYQLAELNHAIKEEGLKFHVLPGMEIAFDPIIPDLLDEGRLTDANGQTVDFSHAVVLMTSNLGASATSPLGFGEGALASTQAAVRSAESFFAPELFNRIDRIVTFEPLSEESAMAIAKKELGDLLSRFQFELILVRGKAKHVRGQQDTGRQQRQRDRDTHRRKHQTQ